MCSAIMPICLHVCSFVSNRGCLLQEVPRKSICLSGLCSVCQATGVREALRFPWKDSNRPLRRDRQL
jgi:hypothetical protein